MQTSTSKVTFPGRPQTFIDNPENGTLPFSCSFRKYDNDLSNLLTLCSRDLRGGAGVKVILDNFVPRKPQHVIWSFALDYHEDLSLATDYQKSKLFTGDIFDNYINVADSMEVNDDCYETDIVNDGVYSIEQSWLEFYESIDCGDITVVDLSLLRPNGSVNAKGLSATGPLGDGKPDSDTSSFFAIYDAIANHVEKGDILSFLQLLGTLNATLRRGGQYKNGIITSSMRWDNPEIVNYLNAPLVDIPGSHKKSVKYSDGLLECDDLLQLISDKRNEESVFLEPINNGDLHYNVCVSGDTWVTTDQGAKRVKDLVGVQFNAIVNGTSHPSTSIGFWSNGLREVVKVKTTGGRSLTLTPDHKLLKVSSGNKHSEWVETSSLAKGDSIHLSSSSDNISVDIIKSITPVGTEEVYDCTIQEVHCFDANGILAHNCMAIGSKPNGVCIINRLNIAQCETPNDIARGLVNATLELCKLHVSWRDKVGDRANIYLPLVEDRQIGVDILGFANFLSKQKVTYLEFTDALEATIDLDESKLSNLNSTALEIASSLCTGYMLSSAAADKFMVARDLPLLDRIHTIEPSQSHAFNCLDLDGFTTARSIFAPMGRKTKRESDSQKSKVYMHGDVETAVEVGGELHQRFIEQWQRMMNIYGKPHAISFDTWLPCTPEWLKWFIKSDIETAYYQFAETVDQSYLSKKVLGKDAKIEACSITLKPKEGCSVCGE